ncbi:MAG: RNase III inhibitor [Gammaproteobacteria bacterium]|nr:MAG: RNase III inhibitor [Gammaproteobacteria bacterium]
MAGVDDRIELVDGDITRLVVDAVVNAANTSLLGGGGVDGAIHRAAGPRLRAHCATLGGCPTGEARITPGFDLPARWIIHAVGPVWRGGGHGEDALLRSAWRHSFALAREHGVRSIAFPAISCGAYGFPPERAGRIAVAECRRALAENPALERVLLVCFDPAVRRAYEAALAEPAKPV